MKLQTLLETLFKISNVDEKGPLSVCNSFYVGEEFKCAYLQYSWSFLKPRILLVNSQYDAWSIYNGSEIRCVTQGKTGKTLSECSCSEMALI